MAGCCERGSEPEGCIRGGYFLIAERLLASPEGMLYANAVSEYLHFIFGSLGHPRIEDTRIMFRCSSNVFIKVRGLLEC